MRMHLCGVRGSTPTPGHDFVEVGGHTSCVALAHDGQPPALVLDAGTGLRRLTTVLAGAPFVGTIVVSHLHWDHLMGLPFFAASDHPDARVTLLFPEQGEDAEVLLTRLMSPPLFPITPQQLRGDWTFATYDEGEFEAEGFHVRAREIPHKGGRTMGIRVADDTGAVAYLPDHAPHLLGPGAHGVGVVHAAARDLATGTDVVLHDAQYTRAELPERFEWGHAAADYAVELAAACRVPRVLLFHHDPSRTDPAVIALRDEVDPGTELRVDVAREGDVVDL